MGNLCPCLKGSESSEHEYAPVPTSSVGADGARTRRDGTPMSSDQYYQSVIEDARSKFINTSGSKRVVELDVTSMRNRLETSSISNPLGDDGHSSITAQSPKSPPSSPGSGASGGSGGAAFQRTIDDINRPVRLYNLDVVADEVAEIVAKRTTDLCVDDGARSSIAAFKSSGVSTSSS